MNATINLTHLAALLSQCTGYPESTAKQFVIEFSEALANALAKGNTVKIKGLGVFTPSEDPAIGVAFVPDEELAQEVNAPFEMFEAVYLDETVTDDVINQSLIEEEPQTEEEPEEEEVVEETPAEPVVEEAPAEPAKEEAITLINPISPINPITPTEPAAEETPAEPAPEPKAEPVPAPTPHRRELGEVEERIVYMERRGPGWGWVVAALLAGMAIGYFLPDIINGWRTPNPTTEVIVKAPKSDPLNVSVSHQAPATPEPENSASVDTPAVETETPPAVEVESKKEIIEVVDGKTYLTTLARKYYGNPDFWSYIYEENRAKLGHPDKVKSGTKVVIPPAEKYGIDASNPESLQAAKLLQAEIYSRFK